MRHVSLALPVLAAALLSGCASLACTPISVVVERKEERPRLRTEIRGYRTDPTGRVVEDRRDVIEPEYWVRGDDGRWYRVDEPVWREAAPGRALSVCP